MKLQWKFRSWRVNVKKRTVPFFFTFTRERERAMFAFKSEREREPTVKNPD